MSGRCVLLVITWTASDWAKDHLSSCGTLTKQNVAIQRVTRTVMKTVTMKMWPFRSTTRDGATAKGTAITWLDSTRAAATTSIALKNSDAARWRQVIVISTLTTNKSVLELHKSRMPVSVVRVLYALVICCLWVVFGRGYFGKLWFSVYNRSILTVTMYS